MLKVGERAPAFELTATNGERYQLGHALTLLLFFKVSCSTCHYAWPFYERLYEAYKDKGLRVWGISQNSAGKTREFQERYGATFPHLVDDQLRESQVYDPEFTPTGYLVNDRQEIIDLIMSWNMDELNRLSRHIATILHVPQRTIFEPGENVLLFKPG